jgi:hypothetical protein
MRAAFWAKQLQAVFFLVGPRPDPTISQEQYVVLKDVRQSQSLRSKCNGRELTSARVMLKRVLPLSLQWCGALYQSSARNPHIVP